LLLLLATLLLLLATLPLAGPAGLLLRGVVLLAHYDLPGHPHLPGSQPLFADSITR
jgi:hypothetical protein